MSAHKVLSRQVWLYAFAKKLERQEPVLELGCFRFARTSDRASKRELAVAANAGEEAQIAMPAADLGDADVEVAGWARRAALYG